MDHNILLDDLLARVRRLEERVDRIHRAVDPHDHHIEELLQQSLANEEKILGKEKNLMADLSRLQASVEASNAGIDSAIALLDGLKAAILAAGTDPVAIAALADEIDAKKAALAAAVVADALPADVPPAA